MLHRSFSSKFGSALGKTTKEDSTVDWQRQCIELEYRNAQLQAAIVSDRVGHAETPLAKTDCAK